MKFKSLQPSPHKAGNQFQKMENISYQVSCGAQIVLFSHWKVSLPLKGAIELRDIF